MKNKFTAETIGKAKAAKSAAELLTIAKESGIELTVEEAKEHYEALNKTGELTDDELDNVAGGGCLCPDDQVDSLHGPLFVMAGDNGTSCPICNSGIVTKERRRDETGVEYTYYSCSGCGKHTSTN